MSTAEPPRYRDLPTSFADDLGGAANLTEAQRAHAASGGDDRLIRKASDRHLPRFGPMPEPASGARRRSPGHPKQEVLSG